jgi:hypothetical protein
MKTKIKLYILFSTTIILVGCASPKRLNQLSSEALVTYQLKAKKANSKNKFFVEETTETITGKKKTTLPEPQKNSLVDNKIETTTIKEKTTLPQNNLNLSNVNLNEVNLNGEFLDDNSLQSYSGEFIIQEGQLVFMPNDCSMNGAGMLLKDLNGGDFKTKKWLKEVESSENKIVNQVLISGVKAQNAPVIFVKKATIPLKPKKTWSSGTASLYLSAAQELYQNTIKLREDYNLFSVSIEEVEDATLGKITEYTLYDAKCNKLSPDEIKKMGDKELSGLNNSLKIGGGLLLKQAALTALAALSTNEILNAGMMDKILMGKDAGTAGIFQAAIVAQLPKIVKNLEASKKYIEQLRGE